MFLSMTKLWLDTNRVKNFFWKKPFIRVFLNITLFVACNDGGISLINFLLDGCQIFLKPTKLTSMIYAKPTQLHLQILPLFNESEYLLKTKIQTSEQKIFLRCPLHSSKKIGSFPDCWWILETKSSLLLLLRTFHYQTA